MRKVCENWGKDPGIWTRMRWLVKVSCWGKWVKEPAVGQAEQEKNSQADLYVVVYQLMQ